MSCAAKEEVDWECKEKNLFLGNNNLECKAYLGRNSLVIIYIWLGVL